MEYLVSSQEMQQYDAYTIERLSLPAIVLMERAALTCVDVLSCPPFDLQRVAVVSGCGNNGGDGVAIARLLQERGIVVDLYLVGDRQRATPQMQTQLTMAKSHGIVPAPLPESLSHYSVIVDALFGVGLSREITGDYAHAINCINQSQRPVLAVDMPSGIHADKGHIMGCAVKATMTVTFAFKKLGLALYPGADYAGEVLVKAIGINQRSFAGKKPAWLAYTPADLTALLPKRANYSNKGSFGKVLVIAGSETMSGAAYFAAKAAYRTGCGLVRIYTAEQNRTILLSQLPEAIVSTYVGHALDADQLQRHLDWASIVIIGPGIGITPQSRQRVHYVISHAQQPVILDADGLTLVADALPLLGQRTAPTIITPHLGEMARLTALSIAHIASNLTTVATDFAKQHHVICVLKDARTIVADGLESGYLNLSGNNGMATGGSGDVLTGIIAGLLAQGMPPLAAARLAVFLHGAAGDIASQQRSRYSLIAEDLINGISHVLANAERHHGQKARYD